MAATIILRCPGCNARIKAPAQLLGQWRACPGCGARLLIRIVPPADAGPVLVSEEAPAGETAQPTASARRAPFSPLLGTPLSATRTS
jgi:DNA-directed RNA polymerase subunit RPC12/RpoP